MGCTQHSELAMKIVNVRMKDVLEKKNAEQAEHLLQQRKEKLIHQLKKNKKRMNQSTGKRKPMIDITIDKEGNIQTNLCVDNQAKVKQILNSPNVSGKNMHLFAESMKEPSLGLNGSLTQKTTSLFNEQDQPELKPRQRDKWRNLTHLSAVDVISKPKKEEMKEPEKVRDDLEILLSELDY